MKHFSPKGYAIWSQNGLGKAVGLQTNRQTNRHFRIYISRDEER